MTKNCTRAKKSTLDKAKATSTTISFARGTLVAHDPHTRPAFVVGYARLERLPPGRRLSDRRVSHGERGATPPLFYSARLARVVRHPFFWEKK